MTLIDRMICTSVSLMREAVDTAVTVDAVATRLGIDPAVARPLFRTDDELSEAVGTYGMVQLADALTQAIVRAPKDDHHAILTDMGRAFVGWARANPDLYRFIAIRMLRPRESLSVIRRHEASFVPLVRRFMGDTDASPSRRALMARSFIVGLADLALDDDIDLWATPGAGIDAEIDAAIADFVSLMLAPARGAPA